MNRAIVYLIILLVSAGFVLGECPDGQDCTGDKLNNYVKSNPDSVKNENPELYRQYVNEQTGHTISGGMGAVEVSNGKLVVKGSGPVKVDGFPTVNNGPAHFDGQNFAKAFGIKFLE